MAPPVSPPTELGAWIARRAAATPRLPAITFEGSTLSYRELADRVDRLAAELAAGGFSVRCLQSPDGAPPGSDDGAGALAVVARAY